jgi:transcriptional regulator with XRE-family HTH domain
MSAISISDWAKLGAAIRDARTLHGLTQNELAASAKVSRSWLAKVESGHRGAELEQILRLLSALGLGLFLQTPTGRSDSRSTGSGESDESNSWNTRTRARDSQSRKEASRALLAAHRKAASRRHDSWHIDQGPGQSSTRAERRELAAAGSA